MSQFPRIWDRGGEREIIGETKVSWLVKPSARWAEPVKVNKRKPNGDRTGYQAQWFLDDHTRRITMWASTHFYNVKQTIGRHTPEVNPETLHRVAELIGYPHLLDSLEPGNKG